MTFSPHASAQSAGSPPTAMQHLHIRSLSPPYGVQARVDADNVAAISIGEEVLVTDHPHVLSLTCVRDMCEPQSLWVKPGIGTQEIDITLTIRPAQLQIEGNFAHRFVIQEEPALGCGCAGVAMTVPLSSGERVVHVTDLQDKRTIAVVLTAGHTSLVSFF